MGYETEICEKALLWKGCGAKIHGVPESQVPEVEMLLRPLIVAMSHGWVSEVPLTNPFLGKGSWTSKGSLE